MSTHLITVLGVSFYQPVRYGKNEKKDKYVQSAMVREFYKDSSDFRVTVLLTEMAEKNNWKNRIVTDKDAEISSKWEEEDRVKSGEENTGLEKVLKSEFPSLCLEGIKIPDGKSNEEIMKIFEIIYEGISEEDEIIFDITHSYRSIPMIIVSVLHYAKIVKKCKLKGIFYGAFEARQNDIAPIIDLSSFNEIIEWSFAAEQFMKYGNAQPMVETFKTSENIANKDAIKNIVQGMSDLSNAIITSRGSSAENVDEKNKKKCSIKMAYEILKKTDFSSISDSRNPAIKELLNKAILKYESLDKNKDYELGMSVVQLCIEFNLINQGFTALEETITTYGCEINELSAQERECRDMVELVVGTKIQFFQPGDKEKKDEGKWAYFTTGNERSAVAYENGDKQVYEKIFNSLSDTFVNICNQIKQCRNDINHFGMRKQPLASDKFKKKLKDLYDKAKQEMGITD